METNEKKIDKLIYLFPVLDHHSDIFQIIIIKIHLDVELRFLSDARSVMKFITFRREKKTVQNLNFRCLELSKLEFSIKIVSILWWNKIFYLEKPKFT